MSLPRRFIRLLYLRCCRRRLTCTSQVYPLLLPPLLWYPSPQPPICFLTQLQNCPHHNILRDRELYPSYFFLHLLQPVLPHPLPQRGGGTSVCHQVTSKAAYPSANRPPCGGSPPAYFQREVSPPYQIYINRSMEDWSIYLQKIKHFLSEMFAYAL